MAGCGGLPARTCVSTNVMLASSTSMTTWPGPASAVATSARSQHFGGPELPHDHRPHGASLTGAILSDSDLIGLFHSG